MIFNDRINLKINDIFLIKYKFRSFVKNIKNNNNNIILHEDYHNLNKYKMKYLKYEKNIYPIILMKNKHTRNR